MSKITMASDLSMRSETVRTSGKGICRNEMLTNQGKKMQLFKMLVLTTFPSLVLIGFTSYTLTKVVEEKQSKEANLKELQFSVELGEMIHQLQRERDMSILYLSALGSETKTFLLNEFIESDNAINELSTWPVDFDTARSVIFASPENMLKHLSSHRQSIDKNSYNIYAELDFYNYIIDTVLSWLVSTVSKGVYETGWKTLVAYLKITIGKQDVGVERALGTYFFVNGGFYDQDKFELYNRRVHKFQAFYYTAKMYSDQVEGLYKEGYLSAGYNVTSVINQYRYEIQNASDRNKNPDAKKAQLWFDNMTIYMDALLGIQKDLALHINNILDAQISTVNYDLIMNIIFLIIVFITCPTVIFSTESLTSNIQRCAVTLVNKTKELSKEKKRTDSLLYQMVPKPVADKLKRSANIEAEYFKSVTVFFSDVFEFSRITTECNPIEVVELLNKLYICIDERVENYDVYKVETINDCYMVASGLPNRNKDRHAVEISNLALDLLRTMMSKPVIASSQRRLQLRIGINTGPCMAGIAGTLMPRYCLFGDTINTAARMKSYGNPNMIHVSETTYKALRKYGVYNMRKRGCVDIKGKGTMITHWLIGKYSDNFAQQEMTEHRDMETMGLPGEIVHCRSQPSLLSVLNLPKPGRKSKTNRDVELGQGLSTIRSSDEDGTHYSETSLCSTADVRKFSSESKVDSGFGKEMKLKEIHGVSKQIVIETVPTPVILCESQEKETGNWALATNTSLPIIEQRIEVDTNSSISLKSVSVDSRSRKSSDTSSSAIGEKQSLSLITLTPIDKGKQEEKRPVSGHFTDPVKRRPSPKQHVEPRERAKSVSRCKLIQQEEEPPAPIRTSVPKKESSVVNEAEATKTEMIVKSKTSLASATKSNTPPSSPGSLMKVKHDEPLPEQRKKKESSSSINYRDCERKKSRFQLH